MITVIQFIVIAGLVVVVYGATIVTVMMSRPVTSIVLVWITVPFALVLAILTGLLLYSLYIAPEAYREGIEVTDDRVSVPTMASFWAPSIYERIGLPSQMVFSTNNANPRFEFTPSGIAVTVVSTTVLSPSEIVAVMHVQETVGELKLLTLRIKTTTKGTFMVKVPATVANESIIQDGFRSRGITLVSGE